MSSTNKQKNTRKKQRKPRRISVIYVLRCEQHKYYVGKTKNLLRRMEEHFSEKAAAWTKLYLPIKLVETHRSAHTWDENVTTLKLMDKYGIENVRGGSFCYIRIGKIRKSQLEDKIKLMKQGKYNGEEKYYSKRRKKMISIKKRVVSSEGNNKRVKHVTARVIYGVICERCGRKNHEKKTCFAYTHKDGTLLCPICSNCGRKGHDEKECYMKKNKKK